MNDKCISCGLCNPVCPTFRATKLQKISPRGFIQLIKDGVSDPVIYNCTLCGKCNTSCPVDVDVVKMLRSARARLVDEGKQIPEFVEIMENLKKTGNIYGIQ